MMRLCSIRRGLPNGASERVAARSRFSSPTGRPTPHPALRRAYREITVSSPEQTIERDAETMTERALRVAPSATTGRGKSGAPDTSLSLPTAVRSDLEPRFGWDFSRVRVHADEEAARAASAVQARAYTVGRDIVFGADEYAPATTRGRRLLAHELAHVVQHESATPGLAGGGVLLRQPKDKPAPVKESAKKPTKDLEDIRGQKRPTLPNTPKSLRLLVVLWDPGRKGQGPRPTAQQIDASLFGSQASSLREFYLN